MKQLHLLILAGLLAAFESSAAGLTPDGWFVQASVAPHGTYTASGGAVWQWSWRRPLAGGEVSGITEVFLSRWSAERSGDRFGLTQVGVLPMLRYRWDQGRSPWFVEAGIGLTVMNRLFTTDDKQFSTRFNFADTVGLGRNFGEGGRREMSVRVTHFSNGGIKHPNPGENMVRLRYAVMF